MGGPGKLFFVLIRIVGGGIYSYVQSYLSNRMNRDGVNMDASPKDKFDAAVTVIQTIPRNGWFQNRLVMHRRIQLTFV